MFFSKIEYLVFAKLRICYNIFMNPCYTHNSSLRFTRNFLGMAVLLVAGTIFAWSNFTFELVKFLNAENQPITGCSGNFVANPFTTVCFYGALFFSAGLIASLVALKEQGKYTKISS